MRLIRTFQLTGAFRASSTLFHRLIATSPNPSKPLTPPPPIPPPIPESQRSQSRTPLEKQFESWIQNLKPGFTPSDVNEAIIAQSDPDLALDIFRWTAQQRGYNHNHLTYLSMIKLATTGKRYRIAETLVEEVIAGACPPSLDLYNSMIKFCCGRKFLFNRAFDIYKKMLKSDDISAKPSLDTYAMLFNSLLRRFGKLNTSYVYLRSVRSLTQQMKLSGVIPDSFVLNMIVKAYSICLEVDEAIRVYREMGLYGCEPNSYTYSYIVKGLCEKGRVDEGLKFYEEMRKKALVPKTSSIAILICSLALEGRFEVAIDVMFDMLSNSLSPDFLTYKTLLEEVCRDGRGEDAFKLLEDFRKKDRRMNEKTYRSLLDVLHFSNG